MKILLTGQRGYLGSHIHRFLLTTYRDAEVVVLEEDKTDFYRYEVSLDECLSGHDNITQIIHAGAASHTMISCQEAYDWNYRATQSLSNRIDPAVPFMFFSSCAANIPVTTPYGFSKLVTAEWLQNNREHLCVFIPYNIFGKEIGRTKKFSAPENIIRRQVTYISSPFVRDYIHINDCLQMIKKAIDDKDQGMFEMGTGVGHDFDELCMIGGIDISRKPIFKPHHEDYPIVGPADRVAENPYLETTIDVVEWIRRHSNVQDSP